MSCTIKSCLIRGCMDRPVDRKKRNTHTSEFELSLRFQIHKALFGSHIWTIFFLSNAAIGFIGRSNDSIPDSNNTNYSTYSKKNSNIVGVVIQHFAYRTKKSHLSSRLKSFSEVKRPFRLSKLFYSFHPLCNHYIHGIRIEFLHRANRIVKMWWYCWTFCVSERHMYCATKPRARPPKCKWSWGVCHNKNEPKKKKRTVSKIGWRNVFARRTGALSDELSTLTKVLL